MILKQPLDIKQQIAKSKEHGMQVPDEVKAEKFLGRINYYRFSGYALEYRVSMNTSEYTAGTDFDNIVRIYEFDEKLRNLLRLYLEKVEIYFKTKIAYTFSLRKCTLAPYDQHYLPSNYYRADKFSSLLQHITAEEQYFKDTAFVKHHIMTYKNKMPLWVLVEIMTFSTLSKLYSCMYLSDQEAIANSAGTSARILKNNLHAMAILRNRCSHAGRLYNDTLTMPVAFTPQFLRRHPKIKTNTMFAYIVMLSRRLPDNECKAFFQNSLYRLIAEYEEYVNLDLMGFPGNWHLLI